MSKLIHMGSRLFDQPLLITNAKLREILEVLGPRMELDVDDIPLQLENINTASTGQRIASSSYGPNVAVIPIYGTLVHRATGLSAMSGLTTYESIRTSFDAALDNTDVDTVLLDIDSNGGEVAGLFDLVDHIYESRGVKNIVSVSNEAAYSAAYALASAANKVYLTRTAGVGSIGVVAIHVDQSEADKKAGVKYTPIYAGEYKVDTNPHSPLSDHAKAAIQAQVDTIYELFVATVARNNGIKASDVQGTKAGIYMGQDAIDVGLADGVISFSELINSLGKGGVNTVMVTRGEQEQLANLQAKVDELHGQLTSITEVRDNLQAQNADLLTQLEAVEDTVATAVAEAVSNTTEIATQVERTRVLNILNICEVAEVPELATESISSGIDSNSVKKTISDQLALVSKSQTVLSGLSGQTSGNPLVANAEKRAKAAQ